MKWITALTVLVVAGCAQTEYAPPQEDRKAKEFIAAADKATIYVYRRKGIAGSGILLNAMINGKFIGQFGMGSFAYEKVKPGIVVVMSTTSVGQGRAEIKAEAGKLYFIELTSHGRSLIGPTPVLTPVSEEQGKRYVLEYQLIAKFY